MQGNHEPIVITGIGVISPLGMSPDALWSSFEDGKNCRTIEKYKDNFGNEYSYWTNKIKDWNPQDLLGKRGLQYLQPSTQYLMGASMQALQNASLNLEELKSEDLGVVIGSNFAGMKMTWEYDYTARTRGPKYVSPMQAPNTLVNSPASHLGLRIKSRACNTTISSGQCAGLDAIGYSKKILQKNQAKYVLVGGTEEINSSISWFYKNSGFLSEDTNSDTGMPYNEKSDGIVPGEGAAVLIMERLSDAKKRKAPILAEVCSWSSAFTKKDSFGQRIGLDKAIKKAIDKSGRTTEDVKLIFSSANGIPHMDLSEKSAIDKVFSNQTVPIRSIKSMLGELSGANGLFQMAAAAGALKRNKLPSAESPQKLYGSKLGVEANSNHWEAASINDCILLVEQDYFGSSSAVIIKGV
ncbi:beta-ketoacyl-[acyl-carrier-protein] synthase family protein [Cytobacillus purgationiresistens]|uniref:3-oxoacyl-[acyl-carrier-protein] synthase II n=1 Tax=Cytobacillus purgationiresistens TaxID=863449 RepID=A0ABU0ARA4_9BACI|nr:beta-ketoacyl synthase N-terminal-like domain-containing protein [Cytobacillus purgationiresistens]MDQ0273782.1 3-oxoacyl-[acyl-carrier-protein] synthase II [Cytobacillus purgationiresistens]